MGFLGLFVGSCAVRISTGLWTKMMYFWRSPHVNENFGAKMCSRPGFCSKFIIHMRRTRKELMFLVLKKEGNRDIELERERERDCLETARKRAVAL